MPKTWRQIQLPDEQLEQRITGSWVLLIGVPVDGRFSTWVFYKDVQKLHMANQKRPMPQFPKSSRIPVRTNDGLPIDQFEICLT